MKVLEFWDRNLSKTKSERTRESYIRHVSQFLRFANINTDEDLEELTPEKIFTFVDSSQLSSSSLLAHLSALKHFIKFLSRRNYISKELFAQLEGAIEEAREELNAKRTPRFPKALSDQELKAIFGAVKGKRYEKIYSLFLYSGIRLGEFEKISPKNFYLDKSGILWLKLEPYMTKGNKGRLVPIIGRNRDETFKATENLLKWLDNFEENFRVKRGVLQVYTDRLSKRLGIPFSVHSFRHTYITNLVNSGFPVEVVKEFAGHSSVKTTIETYYKFSQKRAQDMVMQFLYNDGV